MRPVRPTYPSLFWTLAGAFLAVLLVGLVVQLLLALFVVRPLLSSQQRAARVEEAQGCAAALAEALDEGNEDVSRVLRTFSAGRERLYVFQGVEDATGTGARWQVPFSFGLPAPLRELIEEASGEELPAELAAERNFEARGFRPPPTDPPPGAEGSAPPGTGPGPGQGPYPEFERNERDGRDDPGGRDGRRWRSRTGRSRRPPPDLDRWLGPDRQAAVVSAVVRSATGNERATDAPVQAQPEGQVLGTVWLVYPEREFPVGRLYPRPALVFIPAAAVLAALAGLLLFHGLSRRLRLLDAHAARVSAGQLDARVPDLGGDEIGSLADSLNDMTEELSEQRRQLEEAEAQRKRFLADVTHELSTPLTSIRGYAETLLDPAVPVDEDENRAYLGHILDEGQRMGRLIDDLLDLARLEAGAANAFEPVELDLADLIRRQVERRKREWEKAGAQLELVLPKQPVPTRLDGLRMEQVLDNLIGNAIRHAGDTAQVRVSLQTSSADRLQLQVEDDGPGFPEDELRFVFDRFYRGDPARASGGSGLGLAVVREIVRQHGGSIRAENRTEGGARITVELPRVEKM